MSLADRAPARERNPLTQKFSAVTAATAPHALTQRFSYTVPERRRALLHHCLCACQRSGAATGLALAVARIHRTAGGTLVQILRARLYTLTAGVVGQQEGWGPGALLLNPGDILAGDTADASTGGTVLYTLAATATEFDP